MANALSLLIGAIFLVTFLVLVVYATWIFIHRLRRKESPPRSLARWLRDLFDLAQ
jgi:hypothetical protein